MKNLRHAGQCFGVLAMLAVAAASCSSEKSDSDSDGEGGEGGEGGDSSEGGSGGDGGSANGGNGSGGSGGKASGGNGGNAGGNAAGKGGGGSGGNRADAGAGDGGVDGGMGGNTAAPGATAALMKTNVMSSETAGTATFTAVGTDQVKLVLTLTGCPTGAHGAHIHEGMTCGADGTAAGNHLMVGSEDIGAFVGNVDCKADMTARHEVTAPAGKWKLGGNSPNNILNRTIVIHALNPTSARISCGQIKQP